MVQDFFHQQYLVSRVLLGETPRSGLGLKEMSGGLYKGVQRNRFVIRYDWKTIGYVYVQLLKLVLQSYPLQTDGLSLSILFQIGNDFEERDVYFFTAPLFVGKTPI